MAKTKTTKHHKHRFTTTATVMFADNVFWDSSDSASCPVVATTVPNNFVVKRSQAKARWDLDWSGVKNIAFNPTLVDLKFKDINPVKNKVLGGPHNPFIVADVKDKNSVSIGRYVYHVMYDGNEAQDPELDVCA